MPRRTEPTTVSSEQEQNNISNQKRVNALGKEQESQLATSEKKQQLYANKQSDIYELITKDILEVDGYINTIFEPICSIYNSNKSNLVMGSIFGNPYSIQLDTKILFNKSDVDDIYKDASKSDKKLLKGILEECFGVDDSTKYPIKVEYFDVVQLLMLMSDNKKIDGSCLKNCLRVLGNKIFETKTRRLKYSTVIGYGTFCIGTASMAIGFVGFFVVPIPPLQIISVIIMGASTLYMTGTRSKNIFDGVKNKNLNKDIEDVVSEKKTKMIDFFHKKISDYCKSQVLKNNGVTFAQNKEQQLLNNVENGREKEGDASDKEKQNIFSQMNSDTIANTGNNQNDNDALKQQKLLQNILNSKNKNTGKDNKDEGPDSLIRPDVLGKSTKDKSADETFIETDGEKKNNTEDKTKDQVENEKKALDLPDITTNEFVNKGSNGENFLNKNTVNNAKNLSVANGGLNNNKQEVNKELSNNSIENSNSSATAARSGDVLNHSLDPNAYDKNILDVNNNSNNSLTNSNSEILTNNVNNK